MSALLRSGRGASIAIALAFVLLMVMSTPQAHAVPPPLLNQFCPQGSAAEQCLVPRGVAVDPASGNAYVADERNARINEFTAWGVFIKTWGWGVVASGPGDDPQNEIQQVSVDATGGSFKLRFRNNSGLKDTTSIPFNASSSAVQAALESTGPPDGLIPGLNPGDVAVTGPSGGPWAIEFTGAQADADIRLLEAMTEDLTGGSASANVVTVQGGANFEMCVPSNGDVCRAGQEGEAPGQLSQPQGVALDSASNIYVVDLRNRRVQKFSSAGQFQLMFGGGVNQGPLHSGNLCTATHISEGDICGAGSVGTGAGEFGSWITNFSGTGSFITIDRTPTETVYVGDKERIQRFSTGGVFEGNLPDPDGAVAAGGIVQSLAVEPGGDLYASFFDAVQTCCSEEDVIRLNPAGELVGTLKVKNPRAIAVADDGVVHVVNTNRPAAPAFTEVLRFSPIGAQLEATGFAKDLINASTGIATSSACGIDGTDVFVSNSVSSNASSSNESFVALYGPPPDPGICPPPAVPPSINDQFATAVDTSGATVRAEINPHFWTDAKYFVQYGTGKCSEGGCTTEQPLPPGALLTSEVKNADVTTSAVVLTGLAADTTYHYRFVAESSGGGPVFGVGGEVGNDGAEASFHTFPTPQPPPATDPCPNAGFRTGASAALPDCRAYEMVSPLDKNNGDISNINGVFADKAGFAQAASDGEGLTFSSLRAFGDPEGAPLSNQYLSSRDPSAGWMTSSISAPRNSIGLYPAGGAMNILLYKGFTEDLCSGWMVQDVDLALTPGAPPEVPNLYRRGFCQNPGYELLSTVAPPNFGFEPNAAEYLPIIQGFSEAGNCSVFRANDALTPNANPEKGIFQVYHHDGAGNLRLVSVLPGQGGEASSESASAGTTWWSFEESLHHAVSADCSRVFWSETEMLKKTGPLYVRLNSGEAQSNISGAGKCTQPAKACTLTISSEQAEFWGADSEGNAAVYIVGDQLHEGVGGELREFDVESQTSRLIANGALGVMGSSEDLGRLYFVSTEVLSGEVPNSEGDKAQAGEPNLYLHERAGNSFTFVATFSEEDTLNEGSSGAPPSPIGRLISLRTSRVSPNGLQAAFNSEASLTGYNNTDALSGETDSEVYHFEASTSGGSGELRCVSCNPSGARPSGRLVVVRGNDEKFWAAAQIPVWNSPFRPSRALTADGQRLFFNSFDSLVLGDTNGKKDLYQWEASGTGGCTQQAPSYSPPNGGCLSLISSGRSPADSEFFDASTSGADVFFSTQSSLLPQDTDLVDVYDARIGGGFPPPPSPPVSCEGEACQPPPAPPNDPTPASATFDGPGNVTQPKPKRCPKGKMRRGGRCVKKSKAKRKSQQKQGGQSKRRAGDNRRVGR